MSSGSGEVTPQGGILEGGNPVEWDSKNPIVLFVIQRDGTDFLLWAGIIIILCRVLHWPLSKIRQPRVIAEVIGGIMLGPSVFGRIPGFTDAIFPSSSIPTLNLVANLGLCLFLFLVGLETDLRYLLSNWRVALSVSSAGMVLPFGLGCAISYGLYHEFRNDPGVVPINFGTYLLFVGIAMAITAFPVLCRILTELKLLGTNVGVIVLSAGVGNDVTGWILLALCVSLVNAGNGIVALWVLLVCVGFILFLFFAIRPMFLLYLRRTGSLEKGPSQSVVAVTILLALASAFVTQVIGVHAIFGAFITGLICPHEGGFAIKLTEKIEDLVGALFLPLYFTLSGLQTDVGLLDSGIAWAYVVGVIAVAFFAKVIGGTFASRYCGLLWRESLTVGVLMSCKGLVELIVLNIGLQANILSQRTFTIFVVMALVTTFLTTPLTTYLYPKSYQDKVAAWRRKEINWAGDPLQPSPEGDGPFTDAEKLDSRPIKKIAVYLRLDSLSSVCLFVSLLGTVGGSTPPAPRTHHSKQGFTDRTDASVEEQPDVRKPDSRPTLQAHGIRLMELADRLSSTMKVSEADEYSVWDPVINVFRSFSQLNNIFSIGRVAVVPEHSYADSLIDMARDLSADFLLVPWSASGSMGDLQGPGPLEDSAQSSKAPYPSFVLDILSRHSGRVGILVDKALGPRSKQRPTPKRSPSSRSLSVVRLPDIPSGNQNQHVLFLFFGGADDRFALEVVLQLARKERVTATIVHVDIPAAATTTITTDPAGRSPPSPSTPAVETPASGQGLKARDGSRQSRYLPIPAEEKANDTVIFGSMRDNLPEELSNRVVFRHVTLTDTASTGVSLAVATAQEEARQTKSDSSRLVVVGRRSIEGEPSSADPNGQPDTRSALGVLGDALVKTGIDASVLVLQS